ncbi:hypothetical protein SAMN02745244_00777 [Tessaracoccus bendigoensis DSM 12906]|uniref:Calcineurin-like phosphoesterase domain-containing protein n=1 Tax=Tessaracoccus bendigoensis DSM 12906 TaxID=1123357 RepID=A0A1M6CY31_9ACTN|nr:metallophosphoesterase [Tessaracoccus bendigoensis]SHI65771.1 hypothetical protein SAMN02745244_00777 [Tessaracoccus bendigoensis DSM 12906]
MATAVLLVGVLTVWRATWEVRHTKLNETTYASAELSGELRVLQITDFHNLPRAGQVDSIVDLARGAEPDLIALTGDLINTHNETLDPVRQLLDGLARIDAPRFYVDGNHDHWSSDQQALHALLDEYGVTVLVNESLIFDGDFGRVQLVGVDDYFSGHGDLARAVSGLPQEAFRLALTHSPDLLPVLDDAGVDYALCGHTHGGQVRLPLLGALYQPGGDWFPKISKGPYTEGGSTLYVDSGVGVTGPPFRLFNQSQVTLHRIGSGL